MTIKALCVTEGADRPTVATFIGLHHAAVVIISDSTAITRARVIMTPSLWRLTIVRVQKWRISSPTGALYRN